MNNLVSQLNKYYSGPELLEQLKVLPPYRNDLTTIPERLMALLDVYKIFIPNQTTIDIYNRLYLSLVNSLDKKNTLLETQLANDNFRSIKGLKRYGVIGGMESFRITGTAGLGKTSSIQRCADVITGNKIITRYAVDCSTQPPPNINYTPNAFLILGTIGTLGDVPKCPFIFHL